MKTLEKEVEKSKVTKTIDKRILGELISTVQHRSSPIADYRELTETLNKEFKLNITEDEIINYFTPQICEIENELLYKQYGF